MGKSFDECWRERKKAQIEIEQALDTNAKESEQIGKTMGAVGINIARESYHRTLEGGMMRIVENELPEAEKIGKATATQILNERRKTLLGYLARFLILFLLIGALALCLSIPHPIATTITFAIALIGAFLTDPRL